MKLIYLLIWVFHLSEGESQRLWKKEEWNQTLDSSRKELEAKHISLSIHSCLSKISIRSSNMEIFSKDFPVPRDQSLVAMGFLSSVMVIVVKIHSIPKVMASKEFFTGQPTEGHILLSFLRSIQPNRLVIFIGRPNFLRTLSMEEEQFLTDQGSMFISTLKEKDSWIMALVTSNPNEADRPKRTFSSFWEESNSLNLFKNNSQIKLVKDYLTEIESMIEGRTEPKYSNLILGETKLKSSHELSEFGSSVMHIFVPIFTDTSNCPLYSSPENSLQAEFCSHYEGYGKLCRCQETYIPRKRNGPIPIAMKEQIPIVIVTANKPQTLYRLLRNLDVVRGSDQTEKLIVVDGFMKETLELGKLFGINVRVHKPQGNSGDNTRTNMNIGFALWAAFGQFQDADKVILLEDDLLLSPDLLSFFHETSVLLDVDERISHVSAFGQNSFPLTAGDLNSVLRAEMYPQYGWMTTRKWTTHAFRNWVREGKNIDWDWWLFNEGQKMGFEAIVPEVSRTGHVGSSGAHVTGYDQLQKFHFRVMSSNRRPSKEGNFHVERLAPSERYDNWMDEEIRKAQKIKLTVHPCVEEIFPPNKTGPFVLYLGVTSREDSHESLYLLQSCLGTDAIDVKEIFNGVLRLNVISHFDVEKSLQGSQLERRILYLVGCPLSKYCKYSETFKDWTIPSENILEIAAAISARRRAKFVNHIHRFRMRKLKKGEAYLSNKRKEVG